MLYHKGEGTGTDLILTCSVTPWGAVGWGPSGILTFFQGAFPPAVERAERLPASTAPCTFSLSFLLVRPLLHEQQEAWETRARAHQ